MVVTIQLEGPLAAELQATASARQLSPEELARRLLDDALAQLRETEQRKVLNRRRLALLEKRVSTSLSHSEEEELRRLQEAARCADPSARRA